MTLSSRAISNVCARKRNNQMKRTPLVVLALIGELIAWSCWTAASTLDKSANFGQRASVNVWLLIVLLRALWLARRRVLRRNKCWCVDGLRLLTEDDFLPLASGLQRFALALSVVLATPTTALSVALLLTMVLAAVADWLLERACAHRSRVVGLYLYAIEGVSDLSPDEDEKPPPPPLTMLPPPPPPLTTTTLSSI